MNEPQSLHKGQKFTALALGIVVGILFLKEVLGMIPMLFPTMTLAYRLYDVINSVPATLLFAIVFTCWPILVAVEVKTKWLRWSLAGISAFNFAVIVFLLVRFWKEPVNQVFTNSFF